MTVEELIEQLQGCTQTAEVWLEGDDKAGHETEAGAVMEWMDKVTILNVKM